MNPKGRPPKPPGQSKTEVFHVRCTKAEKLRYQQLQKTIKEESK